MFFGFGRSPGEKRLKSSGINNCQHYYTAEAEPLQDFSQEDIAPHSFLYRIYTGKMLSYKHTAKRRKKSVENDSSDDNGNCSYMVCSYVAYLRPLLRYRV